jgi:endonuclease III
MSEPTNQQIVKGLLARHGRTFAEELGIKLGKPGPSALFRLLCAATLLSARIGHKLAMRAAAALAQEGWTTARVMAKTTWQRRTRVLNKSGYARYDEKTSTMLGDTARRTLELYGGDLRKLREAAGRERQAERELLKEFKGIGDVGADIFCREVQVAWDELYPFADKRVLDSARKLGLPADADRLAKLVSRRQFPRLVAALMREALK